METSAPVVEVNGAPVTPADLELLAFSNYGHYTSMQVRQHAVRGLDLHLSRLDPERAHFFRPATMTGPNVHQDYVHNKQMSAFRCRAVGTS